MPSGLNGRVSTAAGPLERHGSPHARSPARVIATPPRASPGRRPAGKPFDAAERAVRGLVDRTPCAGAGNVAGSRPSGVSRNSGQRGWRSAAGLDRRSPADGGSGGRGRPPGYRRSPRHGRRHGSRSGPSPPSRRRGPSGPTCPSQSPPAAGTCELRQCLVPLATRCQSRADCSETGIPVRTSSRSRSRSAKSSGRETAAPATR